VARRGMALVLGGEVTGIAQPGNQHPRRLAVSRRDCARGAALSVAAAARVPRPVAALGEAVQFLERGRRRWRHPGAFGIAGR
jgi:hypothetical protein